MTFPERWAPQNATQDGDALAEELKTLQLQPDPAPPQLRQGAWCVLQGLRDRPDLNGADVHQTNIIEIRRGQGGGVPPAKKVIGSSGHRDMASKGGHGTPPLIGPNK